MSENAGWKDRLFGGLKKTSGKLTDNIAGLVTKAKLEARDLDEIEDALIASDLGPAMAAQIRDKIAAGRFDKGIDAEGIRQIVEDEVAAVLAPVASPLEIDAFPRPQVILVIGVNGSGKTTTIAKLARLFKANPPARTIVFLACSGHFEALAGAREFEALWGREPRKAAGLLLDEAQLNRDAQALFRTLNITIDPRRKVEGLSIAAISYYVISLLLYLAKAGKAAGLPLHPEMAAGALVPVVLWAVWRTTQRIHAKLHGDGV